ncbi:MAG: molybdopterin-dependent oxidoreductase [Oscillospiraceae bacterium]
MIRHSICDICTPGLHCGMELTVEDGKITSVRGTPDFPVSGGKLCVKGLATAQYVYREDRIQQPMRRVGPRGSEQFEPISWEEALDEVARQMTKAKEEAGPESVLFMVGYEKWMRTWLQRLAFGFGSPNYITESSTCNQARVLAWRAMFGTMFDPDMRRASVCIGWGYNPAGSQHVAYNGLKAFKARGGLLLIVDPRRCEAAEMADLYLQPRNGTDTALAFAIARELFVTGGVDQEFIDRYVAGAEEYRALVEPYTPEYTETLTGVPAEDIRKAATFFYGYGPVCLQSGNAIPHRTGGFDLYRAVISLMALTGNIDKPGGALPKSMTFAYSDSGTPTREFEYTRKKEFRKLKSAVGAHRFPFWNEMLAEGQGMELTHWLETGGEYPLKAALCFGVNHMMYPESERFQKAMDKLDFIMAADLVWTETCRHADIVLPVLSSVERSEIKCYAGKFVYNTTPAIDPVVDGKDDVAIITELARRLMPDDELLCCGYDASAHWMLEPAGITDWDAVRAADGPVPIPNAKPYEVGSYLKKIPTPSGKIELVSSIVAKYEDAGLTGLPHWTPPDGSKEYPFTAMLGARLPYAMHSRCHKVPQLRKLRPEPLVDICPADAERLGIAQGDSVEIYNAVGSVTMKANLSKRVQSGEISMYHGYEEANCNELIPIDLLDPYTGFPAYKQVCCNIRKI